MIRLQARLAVGAFNIDVTDYNFANGDTWC